MSRNVAPAKPARVQKQARPAFVKKQKIKTAPKAKIKGAAPAAKALPSKASAAPPKKQAATVIRKGQVLPGYSNQSGQNRERGWEEGPAGNRGSGRKVGRGYRRRRRGCCFRCCCDPACWDVVCFAARYPVRR